MRHDPPKLRGAAKNGIAGLVVVAFAVVCCGALPLVAALASTLAIGAVLGVGAGILAIVAVVGAVAIRLRRRRACTVAPRAGLDHR